MNNLIFSFIPNRENNTLTIRREFAAPRQLVWDCYTNSELLNQWFAPFPFTTKTKSMDFSEGGHWHYAMIDPTGPEYWGYTGFVKIKPIDFYTTIDSFSDADGNINTELPGAEWVVSFSDRGANTLVETVVQYKSLSDLETIIQMGMEEGMKSTLTKLDDLLIQLTNKTR